MKMDTPKAETRIDFRARILRSTALVTLTAIGAVASSSAFGQAQPSGSQPAAAVEQVVVTGSRVIQNGADAPTPVTVVSAAALSNLAPQTLAQSLNMLPQLQNSPTTQGTTNLTTGDLAANYLNLRSLGANRTLVLFDGRRVVPNSSADATDVGFFPSMLIQRVDIVTGGASAAYGSDAVAGVVNFVLDKKFTGIKANMQAGIADAGDNEDYGSGVAFGQDFDGGRGHVIASAEYFHSDPTRPGNRPWQEAGYGILINPNVTATNPASVTNPKYVLAQPVNLASGTTGGLITSGPLKGTAFGPGGALQQFNFGQVSGTAMIGGTLNDPNAVWVQLPSLSRGSLFVHSDYAITPFLNVFAEGTLGETSSRLFSESDQEVGTSAFTIYAGNPFIPAQLAATMSAQGITSFPLGRLSEDFSASGIGLPKVVSSTQSRRVAAGFDGIFGDGWSYEGSYSHGESIYKSSTSQNAIKLHLYNAADAVSNPAVGGVAGVAVGAPICRSTLTNPSNGCVPIDLFGEGSPSPAAINYVSGTAYRRSFTAQDFLEFGLRGEPFELWAGPLAIAIGGSYRREAVRQTVDSISSSTVNATGLGFQGFPSALQGGLGGFDRTNPQPLVGAYDVKEAYGEVEIPILKDLPFAESLNFNGAARYADYSTAGGVTTWKVGTVYQPVDEVRIRGTLSRDIRAASLLELFSAPSQGQGTVVDPFSKTTHSDVSYTVGNPNLLPERADTATVGAVYQPNWLEGFTASVDYYRIGISDAIGTLAAQTEVNQCAAGNTSFCADVVQTSPNLIGYVYVPELNINSLIEKGVDIETSYQFNVLDGQARLRGIFSNIEVLKQIVPGAAAPILLAGQLGNIVNAGGVPNWTGLMTAEYATGPVLVALAERYMSSGTQDNSLSYPGGINNNIVPPVFYTNLSVGYSFGAEEQYEIVGNITNLFNRTPPLAGAQAASSYGLVETNRALYDMIGRDFSIILKFHDVP